MGKFLIFIFVSSSFSLITHAQVIETRGGGYIVSKSRYPAVVRIDMGRKGWHCSATLVGPNVILTATHCADDKFEEETVIHKFGHFYIGTKKYNFTFYTHQEVMNENLDMAIGIVDQDVQDVTPMTISFDEKLGKKMIMLGYGCTKDYLTETYVISQGTGDDARSLVSSVPNKKVFACGGDSGGPTVAYNLDLKLRINGVHYFSNRSHMTGDLRTDTQQVKKFVQTMAEKENLKICGYNLDCD